MQVVSDQKSQINIQKILKKILKKITQLKKVLKEVNLLKKKYSKSKLTKKSTQKGKTQWAFYSKTKVPKKALKSRIPQKIFNKLNSLKKILHTGDKASLNRCR